MAMSIEGLSASIILQINANFCLWIQENDRVQINGQRRKRETPWGGMKWLNFAPLRAIGRLARSIEKVTEHYEGISPKQHVDHHRDMTASSGWPKIQHACVYLCTDRFKGRVSGCTSEQELKVSDMVWILKMNVTAASDWANDRWVGHVSDNLPRGIKISGALLSLRKWEALSQ